MRKRRLLLASSALVTVVGCGGHDKKPQIYANPKGSHYAMDAGVDSGSGSGSGSATEGSGSDAPPPSENK